MVSFILISTGMLEMLVLVEKRGILHTGQTIQSTGGRMWPFHFTQRTEINTINSPGGRLTMQQSQGISFLFICSDEMSDFSFFIQCNLQKWWQAMKKLPLKYKTLPKSWRKWAERTDEGEDRQGRTFNLTEFILCYQKELKTEMKE